MKYLLIALVLFSGCATPPVGRIEPAPGAKGLETAAYRRMIVYVPQTDDAAATWLKWFEMHPNLRMVIAVSPRFVRIPKDPVLKARFQALEKEGRLELALQIPNAPILPLIAEDPPYGFTEDIVQIIAQSKAGFYKNWNFLPKGLVLPYGAVSPRLLTMLDRSGFDWIVAAYAQAQDTGLLQMGSIQLWDGTSTRGFVRVWDERQMKDRPLEGWMKDIATRKGALVLPHDRSETALPVKLTALEQKTWDGSDWSSWTNEPAKNAAWGALRTTRETLEKYKNSGQASLGRLDAAVNEIYSAQNSNYFASAGNLTMSPALKEEREHEFQATLLGIYRLAGLPAPDDLFTSASPQTREVIKPSSTTIQAESFPDGREHVVIRDAVGDELVRNGGDLESLNVWTTSDTAHWVVTFTSTSVRVPLEIYIDLNHQPGAGTSSMLSGRSYFASERDAWEYALAITESEATFYRTQGSSQYGDAQRFPVVVEGRSLHVYMPQGEMRGRPSRWGYQVLVGVPGSLSDYIDPPEIPQKELSQALTSGNRHDIPSIRIKRD